MCQPKRLGRGTGVPAVPPIKSWLPNTTFSSANAADAFAGAFKHRSLIIQIEQRVDVSTPAGVEPVYNCGNRVKVIPRNRHGGSIISRAAPGAGLRWTVMNAA